MGKVKQMWQSQQEIKEKQKITFDLKPLNQFRDQVKEPKKFVEKQYKD